VGSIEYAVSTFGTPLVVVMGHTQCGAVKATVDHIMNSTSIPTESIHDIVARIKPHVYNVCQAEKVSVDEKVKQATTDNVIASCNELWHSSRLIEGLIAEDKLSIIGSVFQLETGQVKFLEDEVN
jgi:carbonic anhydrase